MRPEWALKQLLPVHGKLGVFEASCWSEADIPRDWIPKGSLLQTGQPGEAILHRFYDLQAGRIAVVMDHSLLGRDALMVRVGPADWAREIWKGLVARGARPR